MHDYSTIFFAVCQDRNLYVSSVVGLLPFGGLDQLCIAQAESVFQPSVCLLCQESVSYTHLDVYKRQILGGVILIGIGLEIFISGVFCA